MGKPVGLLKLSGAIEAARVSIVAGLMLYLNHHAFSANLRPSWFIITVTALAGLFFVVFATDYWFRLVA